MKVFSFPVNTDKFNSVKERHTKKKIFIYYKRRNLKDLQYITNFLTKKGLEYRVFDYITRYSEEDNLNYLLGSQYGIILGRHESQGFALEEAMSCNVPLLVWNTKSMAQEEGSHYDDIPCTTIPYWDKRCGEYFYEREDFKKKFHEFTNKLEIYQPRQFVLENLSVESSATQLLSLIKSIKVKNMEEKSKYVG